MISPASLVIQVSLQDQWSSAMVSSKNNSNLHERSHLHKLARRIAQLCNQCSGIRVFSVMILCTSAMSWCHTPETHLKHMFYDVFPKICDTPKSTQIIPQNWSTHVHSNRILWLITQRHLASQLCDLSWPFRLARWKSSQPTIIGWLISLLTYPPQNKGLIRSYEGKPMVNKPLIRPCFCDGYVSPRRLTSHLTAFPPGSGSPADPPNRSLLAPEPGPPTSHYSLCYDVEIIVDSSRHIIFCKHQLCEK